MKGEARTRLIPKLVQRRPRRLLRLPRNPDRVPRARQTLLLNKAHLLLDPLDLLVLLIQYRPLHLPLPLPEPALVPPRTPVRHLLPSIRRRWSTRRRSGGHELLPTRVRSRSSERRRAAERGFRLLVWVPSGLLPLLLPVLRLAVGLLLRVPPLLASGSVPLSALRGRDVGRCCVVGWRSGGDAVVPAGTARATVRRWRAAGSGGGSERVDVGDQLLLLVGEETHSKGSGGRGWGGLSGLMRSRGRGWRGRLTGVLWWCCWLLSLGVEREEERRPGEDSARSAQRARWHFPAAQPSNSCFLLVEGEQRDEQI